MVKVKKISTNGLSKEEDKQVSKENDNEKK